MDIILAKTLVLLDEASRGDEYPAGAFYGELNALEVALTGELGRSDEELRARVEEAKRYLRGEK